MKPRDLELLSAYLDGELSPSDSTRLEARIRQDPDLDSALRDLRAARTLLRKLPKRRAPRNFTLTHKMVEKNPPLPRAYPVFRFATAAATLLFFLTFGFNLLAPQITQAPGFGFGGGGGPEETNLFSAAPAATEAPALEAATEAPAATQAPVGAADLAPAPTLAPTETARIAETPVAKTNEAGNAETQSPSRVVPEVQKPGPIIPSVWLLVFAGAAILGVLFMLAMRRSSMNRWK